MVRTERSYRLAIDLEDRRPIIKYAIPRQSLCRRERILPIAECTVVVTERQHRLERDLEDAPAATSAAGRAA